MLAQTSKMGRPRDVSDSAQGPQLVSRPVGRGQHQLEAVDGEARVQ